MRYLCINNHESWQHWPGAAFGASKQSLANCAGWRKLFLATLAVNCLTPSYREVYTGTTGHAEVIQITFDPQIISFRELLGVFFTIHDPTTLNQGADAGTQYRSAILHHMPEQEETAQEVIAELGAAKIWDAPIATEVAPFNAFYPAEG